MSAASIALAGGIVAAAAVLTAALNILLRPLLVRYALARPNARSSHRVPTPQGGGMSVIAATLAVTAAVAFAAPHADRLTELALIAAATISLAIVGAIDDIRPLPTAPRLATQLLTVGTIVALLPAPVLPILPFWLDRVVLVLAGVWFVNLVNFMDGIDLMTVAEVVPITAGLVIASAFGALRPLELVTILALAGAMIGFAPFNRPVAKLFLGDVGSLPIGLLLFWSLSQLAAGHLAAALLLPLYYLADATIVLLRRAIDGEPITQAHRTHFDQRATERGFTVMDIVARVFLVNIALVALATITIAWPSRVVAFVALALGCALVGWLLFAFARGKKR
jgi:UDP-N-acetylmuramyl pentapeptide phosphotransferase/UDP-N-acetylglucosamine-1-phosphate transferase